MPFIKFCLFTIYYFLGQVSVSSSAAASVKYPPPGSGGSPQAYISSLSSAKADPKIPVTVNDGAAGTAQIVPVAPTRNLEHIGKSMLMIQKTTLTTDISIFL